MSSHMTSEVSKRISIHQDFNILYFVPGFSHLHNPPCRMHQTDAGIFCNMLDDIKRLLDKAKIPMCVTRFSNLWGCLISFPGVKRFLNGVLDSTKRTAADCRSIAMNLPFVVRGVDYEFQLSNKFKLSSGFLETLALVYVMWRWVLGLEEITQSLADILEALEKSFKNCSCVFGKQ